MRAEALALGVVFAALLGGCLSVGTRVCAEHQAGCDFTDHVLRIWPSGTLCPTWDVQFAQYNPEGEPTDSYGVLPGNDQLMENLRNASAHDKEIHVWYAGEKYVVYPSCHSDYPLVIYQADPPGAG